MIKFNVSLTETDIKKFIVHRMNLKRKEVIVPFFVYILSIILAIVANILKDLGIIGWLATVSLFIIFCFKTFSLRFAFKKMLVQNLDIIGKDREIFADKHSLSIICNSNPNFCGKYSMYDLKEYKKMPEYYYLTFNNKAYIIIPIRCLNSSQNVEFLNILTNNFEVPNNNI